MQGCEICAPWLTGLGLRDIEDVVHVRFDVLVRAATENCMMSGHGGLRGRVCPWLTAGYCCAK